MQPTKHGAHNEGLENKKGYCQSASGINPMTDEYNMMFIAEGKYWHKYKHNNIDTWKEQIKRLKHTRGSVFVKRLLKCIEWLEKNNLKGSNK